MHKQFKLLVPLWLILTLSAALLQAQTQKFTISTSIQFPSEKINSFKNSMHKITPRVTYHLNSNFSMGVFYSYLAGNTSNSLKYSNNDIYLDKIYDIKNNGNAGGVIGQYIFFNYKKFKSFIEFESGYSFLNKEIKDGYIHKQGFALENKSEYKEIDEGTFNKLMNDWNIPRNNETDNHGGYSLINTKTELIFSNINIAGSYDFYRGLGVELRLTNLFAYTTSHEKQTEQKKSDFKVFQNIPNNISIGVSYSF